MLSLCSVIFSALRASETLRTVIVMCTVCRAFGVLMWEVLTLGQQPYPARTNTEVLQFVRSGGRLDRPDTCPDEMWVPLCICHIYGQFSTFCSVVHETGSDSNAFLLFSDLFSCKWSIWVSRVSACTGDQEHLSRNIIEHSGGTKTTP